MSAAAPGSAAAAALLGLRREFKRTREPQAIPEMETDDEEEVVTGLELTAAGAASAAPAQAAENDGRHDRRDPGEEAVEEGAEQGAKVARVDARLGGAGDTFVAPAWDSMPPNPGDTRLDTLDRMFNFMQLRDDFPYLKPRKCLEAAGRSRLVRILEKQGRKLEDLSASERLYLEGAVAEFVVEGMSRGFGTAAEQASMSEASGRPGGRTEARWTEIARDPEFAAPRSRLYVREDGSISGKPPDHLQVVNGGAAVAPSAAVVARGGGQGEMEEGDEEDVDEEKEEEAE